MLKTRVIAALIFTPVILGLVLVGGLALQLSLLILTWLILGEFLRLALGPGQVFLKVTTYILGTLFASYWLGFWECARMDLAMIAATIIILIAVLIRPEPIETALKRAAAMGLGIIYAAGLLPFLAQLRELGGNIGLGLCAMALFCTWGADTGAYFSGRALGRHKLYPKISPGKTVEGALGGLVAAVAVAFFIRWLLAVPLELLDTGIIGVLAAVFGLVGDLVESLLKRSANVKDSGSLIPGHGGVLDRFDAVMFVAPVVYFYITWVW